ncbi:MAG: nucleotidyl transferase AbiEii/AbiGii toxin family protein, partial [Candidatus Micrarchaeia archaeon]
SVDLDFVPVDFKNEEEYAKMLKGELSKKGYRAARSKFTNQFVINFSDTTIKVEIFVPEKTKPTKPVEFEIGGNKILVASIEDLLQMKKETYATRKMARDLYDIYCISKKDGGGKLTTIEMIKKYGTPLELDILDKMILNGNTHRSFLEVIANAAKASSD